MVLSGYQLLLLVAVVLVVVAVLLMNMFVGEEMSFVTGTSSVVAAI